MLFPLTHKDQCATTAEIRKDLCSLWLFKCWSLCSACAAPLCSPGRAELEVLRGAEVQMEAKNYYGKQTLLYSQLCSFICTSLPHLHSLKRKTQPSFPAQNFWGKRIPIDGSLQCWQGDIFSPLKKNKYTYLCKCTKRENCLSKKKKGMTISLGK